MVFQKDKVSLYVHWPFCAFKCPYCDFNSHVREGINHARWLTTLTQELDHYADYLSDKEIHTVFFGGGTPSLAHPSVIAGIIEHVAQTYHLANDAEITMEANPTSVEAENFALLAASGVSRISLGIQSLIPEQLKFLGRKHDASEARKAIETAAHFFKRYSFDLIYALPQQSVTQWQIQLQEALQLAGGHLSLYQLTIEKGTKFFDLHRKNKITLPDEETAADLYVATEEMMEQHGYHAYEVSNYCVPGQECQHNLQYWRMGDYLGIGPGAHGRITQNNTRFAIQNIASPESWMQATHKQGHGQQQCISLFSKQNEEERIIMGLRMKEGIHLTASMMEKAKFLCDLGLLESSHNLVKPTLQGRLVLNSLIKHLIV